MSTDQPTGDSASATSTVEEGARDDETVADLSAQLDVLNEENQRLREEYARARRTRYRRTALALAVVGIAGILGGLALPQSQTVLFALGGTGLFTAVLTYYLTPEQFISAEVGEGVYSALARTETALVDELGLQDEQVYVPTASGAGEQAARLFVPQQSAFDVPDQSSLESLFVVTAAESERGVAIPPTGEPLFSEFERTLSGPLSDEPELLATQLTDSLVEQFELARSATVEFDEEGRRLSVAIDDSAYGAVDRLDHPIMSFLGVGLAVGLDQPVTVESIRTDDDRAEYLVACSWSDLTESND